MTNIVKNVGKLCYEWSSIHLVACDICYLAEVNNALQVRAARLHMTLRS